jgi:alpha-ribazole phosphatase
MPLWLVRHAQPLVEAGVCYGATDMPADAGATAAACAALAPQLPQGAQLWCSPRRRCMQLADALLHARTDLNLQTDERLVEMDFGCWEGVRWDAIPKAEIDAWTAQFWHGSFGGRDTVSALMARVGAAWVDAQRSVGPVVWVTHAGVVRAATLLARGVTTVHRADHWPVQAPGFGQLVTLPLLPLAAGVPLVQQLRAP